VTYNIYLTSRWCDLVNQLAPDLSWQNSLRGTAFSDLRVEDIQQREEHWVIADLVGKGGHIRTIPVPDWVKAGIDAWTGASGITSGTLLRSINKAGRIWGTGFSPKVIWGVVKQKAKGCEIPSFAPHDLR
jgi:integrase